MAGKMRHADIRDMITALGEAKVVDLQRPVADLVEPIARHMPGDEVSLHILCCNEYFLVTGLADPAAAGELRVLADAVRESLRSE